MEKPHVRPLTGKYQRRPRPGPRGAAAGSLAKQPTGERSAPPHHHQPALLAGDGVPAGRKRAASSPPEERPSNVVVRKTTTEGALRHALRKIKSLKGKKAGLESKISELEGKLEEVQEELGLEKDLTKERRIALAAQAEEMEELRAEVLEKAEDDEFGNGRVVMAHVGDEKRDDF